MRPSQILAIDTVDMEAEPGCRDRLIWFYADLVGLDLEEKLGHQGLLLFSSARRVLRINLVHQAVVEKVRRRALLSVQSLEAVAELLEAEAMPHQRVSGMSATDRRITLLDPAENRVELKQEWRAGVFSGPAAFWPDSGQGRPNAAGDKFPQKGADSIF
ncbi:MAG: hypothetical protein ACE5GE_00085 [Phycisphaerae bacterium]